VKNCDQFRELIEAYALGALDTEDRAALEAHLATDCTECAKAVEEARWLVSQLAYAAPEAAPSDMLKGRLMQTVRAEAQSQAKPHVLPVKSTVPFWLGAGVAALLIFSIYSAWNTRRLEKEIREANQRAAALYVEHQKIEVQLADAKREATIMMDPTSHKIALWGEHAHPETLEAKWHSQLGVCIVGDKVPMPSANHVLQLWFIPKKEGGKPMPSAMVRPDASGKLMLYVSDPPQSMDDTKAIAITEEPAGGSGWPTSPILWSGNVT
jgi:anti-sigma-K factor RskA